MYQIYIYNCYIYNAMEQNITFNQIKQTNIINLYIEYAYILIQILFT